MRPQVMDEPLLRDFEASLSERCELEETEKESAGRLVQATVYEVMLEMDQGVRPLKVKTLRADDVRPFFEDNKAIFEELWRKSRKPTHRYEALGKASHEGSSVTSLRTRAVKTG